MSADQLFESPASLSCARLLIQYGAGNCEKVYCSFYVRITFDEIIVNIVPSTNYDEMESSFARLNHVCF